MASKHLYKLGVYFIAVKDYGGLYNISHRGCTSQCNFSCHSQARVSGKGFRVREDTWCKTLLNQHVDIN